MRISERAYLAVETMVRLAVHDRDKPCTSAGLAEWINRPQPCLVSLLARLQKAGLVVPRPGPADGYVLACPANHITVADVFDAVDEPSGFAPLALNSHTLERHEPLDLHGTDRLWDELERHVLSFLSDVSLADLASDAPRLVDGRFRHEDRVCPVKLESPVRH